MVKDAAMTSNSAPNHDLFQAGLRNENLLDDLDDFRPVSLSLSCVDDDEVGASLEPLICELDRLKTFSESRTGTSGETRLLIDGLRVPDSLRSVGLFRGIGGGGPFLCPEPRSSSLPAFSASFSLRMLLSLALLAVRLISHTVCYALAADVLLEIFALTGNAPFARLMARRLYSAMCVLPIRISTGKSAMTLHLVTRVRAELIAYH